MFLPISETPDFVIVDPVHSNITSFVPLLTSSFRANVTAMTPLFYCGDRL